ncbi:hypothetical protein H0X48_03435 [Candidatus Dependentiae bacterium]|nr:hypothetical protein [Candidatus Dependentiae bacterium]
MNTTKILHGFFRLIASLTLASVFYQILGFLTYSTGYFEYIYYGISILVFFPLMLLYEPLSNKPITFISLSALLTHFFGILSIAGLVPSFITLLDTLLSLALTYFVRLFPHRLKALRKQLGIRF